MQEPNKMSKALTTAILNVQHLSNGFFFFIFFCGHISAKTMTSNREVRKLEAKNAASEPLIIMLAHAATKAAKEARVATMVAIAKLVDDAAVENGGRVPKGFAPEVIPTKVLEGCSRFDSS
jgi:hypothetical protein